jgi:hypothetical protein
MFFLQAANELSSKEINALWTPTMWAVGLIVFMGIYGYKIWVKLSDDRKEKEKEELAFKREKELKELEMQSKEDEGTASALRDIKNSLEKRSDDFVSVISKNIESRAGMMAKVEEQNRAIFAMVHATSDYSKNVGDNLKDLVTVLKSKPCGEELRK